jgi:hypothetical protein
MTTLVCPSATICSMRSICSGVKRLALILNLQRFNPHHPRVRPPGTMGAFATISKSASPDEPQSQTERRQRQPRYKTAAAMRVA